MISLRLIRQVTSRAPIRQFSQRTFTTQRILSKKWSFKLTTAAVSLAVAGAVLTQSGTYSCDENKFNESSIEDSVSLDKGVPPFKKWISDPLAGKNELIGYGVRTVTFLKMRVYSLGIYLNDEDIPRLETIIDSKFLASFMDKLGDDLTHRQRVYKALQDPELSMIMIENLLNSQIRFTAKIVPLRNTDFNHLRDGLIKSIMACPKSKEILQQGGESLPNGLDELRVLFGARKGSCPKGHSLYLELLKDSSLVVRYEEIDKKTGKLIKDHVLGEIKEPLVGKLLFMQYLSGPNPLSKETRDKCIETLATFC